TSYLIEAQYKFPITNNIMITPGAYVIFNPNHDDDNDTIWVGAIRTTFKF
ncbi:MAG: carbohydrate porin, partial [Moorea sp. SIO2C4]